MEYKRANKALKTASNTISIEDIEPTILMNEVVTDYPDFSC